MAIENAADDIVRISDRVSRTRFWNSKAKKVDVCHCVLDRDVDTVKVCKTRATASLTVAMECRMNAYIRAILA